VKTAEQWTTRDVAAYLGVKTGTVRAYLVREQMPEPDGHLGARTPWWWSTTIQRWRPQEDAKVTS
jgi:hypothetical protein